MAAPIWPWAEANQGALSALEGATSLVALSLALVAIWLELSANRRATRKYARDLLEIAVGLDFICRKLRLAMAIGDINAMKDARASWRFEIDFNEHRLAYMLPLAPDVFLHRATSALLHKAQVVNERGPMHLADRDLDQLMCEAMNLCIDFRNAPFRLGRRLRILQERVGKRHEPFRTIPVIDHEEE